MFLFVLQQVQHFPITCLDGSSASGTVCRVPATMDWGDTDFPKFPLLLVAFPAAIPLFPNKHFWELLWL